MRLKPAGTGSRGSGERFTGEVSVTMIASTEDALGLAVGIVRFAPGARTNWHRHPTGQTLHVSEGVALVVSRDGDSLGDHAGETVLCPAGVEHWHGVLPESAMAHLAMVATNSVATSWLERVSDEQYAAAREQSRLG
jgi:quercetin dioxygenase-like cupin family protein